MRHLDLFSGIGGFALAAQTVWGSRYENVGFCDNEPFSQAILKKHWPYAHIFDDIKTLRTPPTADLITGGFPCQPFSAAGKRQGTEDDRHLWPEMLRVIRASTPKWVIGENVGGLLTWDGGMVLEQVLVDLEGAGYQAWPFVIPAVAVGAPHRRDRVWIIAHADHQGQLGRGSSSQTNAQRLAESQQVGQDTRGAVARRNKNHRVNTDPDTGGLRRHQRQSSTQGSAPRSSWTQDWPAVATRLCSLDDGLPRGLARPKGWRNAALKGAGNAIVPQVAIQIMRAIRAADPAL